MYVIYCSSLSAVKKNCLPCNCKLCGGKVRDKRTVKKHFTSHPYNRSVENHESPIHNQDVETRSTVNDFIEVGVDASADDYLRDSDEDDIDAFEIHVSGQETDDGDDDSGEVSEESDGDDQSLATNDDGDDIIDSDNDISEEDHDGNDDIHVDGDNDITDDGDDDSGEVSEESDGDEQSLATNDDHGDDSDDDISEDSLNKELEKYILRILRSKVQYGWSQQETLSQIQSLYELSKDERIPYKTWPQVMQFLKKLGYKNPQNYKVCCGTDHITLVDGDECPYCNTPKDLCTDYLVLGLNLKSIFISEKKIKDHLAHWLDKECWFNKRTPNVPYKEIWHGSRFSELSYFWDSEKDSFLPTCCQNCGNIISLNEIQAQSTNVLAPGDRVYLSCSECLFDFVYIIKTAKGNPLNQAFIFHEDGFNAFVKKTRGVSAIHISDACTNKDTRLHEKNIHVYSFVPTNLIKEGIPHKMDAFLKPLINDIKELYLNGVDVYIPKDIELPNILIKEGWCKVRALLLLGTADLKGHAGMTLYAAGKYKIYYIIVVEFYINT